MTQTAEASRIIQAPPDRVYRVIADYREGHPRILPGRYFHSLDVEQGGYGAGTIVTFSMRILGQTQHFRSLITEPEPGRLLLETDIKSETATSFYVVPIGDGSRVRVTISTDLSRRSWVERLLAKPMLQRIYREELALLARATETLAPDPSNTEPPDRASSQAP